MKSLSESIFNDNITTDPFDQFLDRLDPKNYHDTTAAIEQIYDISGEEYFLQSHERMPLNFKKRLSKEGYVLILYSKYSRDKKYAFAWINDVKYNGKYFEFVLYSIKDHKWSPTLFECEWSLTSTKGIDELIDKIYHTWYDYCVFVTDQKKANAIKKRIYEIRKK